MSTNFSSYQARYKAGSVVGDSSRSDASRSAGATV